MRLMSVLTVVMLINSKKVGFTYFKSPLNDVKSAHTPGP